MKRTLTSAVRKLVGGACGFVPALFFGSVLHAITLQTPEAGATYNTGSNIEWIGTIGAFQSGTVDFGTFADDGTNYTYHQEKEVGPLPMTDDGRVHLFTPCPPGGWSPGDGNHYARLSHDPDAPAINYFITINP